MTDAHSELKSHNYILFSTLKKSGEFVATPVWFSQTDDAIYVFSAGDAGKVKRLRNFDSAKVQPCGVLGAPKGGVYDATAVLLTKDADIEAAHKSLIAKYGWQMRLLDVGATLAGRMKTREYIRVTIKSD